MKTTKSRKKMSKPTLTSGKITGVCLVFSEEMRANFSFRVVLSGKREFKIEYTFRLGSKTYRSYSIRILPKAACPIPGQTVRICFDLDHPEHSELVC